jgi:hypothetical protein
MAPPSVRRNVLGSKLVFVNSVAVEFFRRPAFEGEVAWVAVTCVVPVDRGDELEIVVVAFGEIHLVGWLRAVALGLGDKVLQVFQRVE